MNLLKYIFFLLLPILFCFNSTYAQESYRYEGKVAMPISTDFNGYISNTQSAISIDSMNGNWLNDNILHNRLNLNITQGTENNSWVYSLEVRNRLIYGDSKKYIPGYAHSLSNDRGLADMSWNLAKGKSFVLNTSIERLHVTRHINNWEITVGRQRINWGISFAWNPNDLFNNASIFDFDYEEKPGCDAIRTQYYVGPSSALDFVFEMGENEKPTFAGMYKTTIKDYDFQVLTSYYQGTYFNIGLGFSGSLGGGALYGEAAGFIPSKSLKASRAHQKALGMISLGYAYMFPNELDIRGEFFYTQKNTNAEYDDASYFFTTPSSVKNLSPSKYNFMLSANYPITPLLTAGLSSVYYTDISTIYIAPSIEYSLFQNLNVTLFYQYFNPKSLSINEYNEIHETRTNYSIAHLRLKWNF